MRCPNCGKEVNLEDATFCPYCKKPLSMPKKLAVGKFTPFILTAGVTTIIASCFAIVAGLISIVLSLTVSWGYGIYLLIAGIIGIVAFAFGITGGIFAIKRTRSHMPLSIFGMSFLIASGVLVTIPTWFFGVPIVVLAVVSVVFAGIARNEFV